MKKTSRILILILLACVVAACAFGCNNNEEFDSFSVIKEEIAVKIGGRFTLANCFETTGKGKIYYTVENPDVMSVDGGVLTGLAEGKGYVYAVSGRYEARIKVVIYDADKINVRVNDATFTYDGEVKNVSISGNIPEDATIKYYVDGEEFFGTATPGKYKVRAEVILSGNYKVNYLSDTATLTINRATIPINVSFKSATFDYDGTEKRIDLTGDIPDGVEITIENNAATDAGVYGAKVYFTVDERYYEPIRPMTATLTIKKKGYNVDFTPVNNPAFTYDGTEKLPSLTLSEGLKAEYFAYDEDKNVKNYIPVSEYKNKYAEEKPFAQSGTYRMKVTFSALDGYETNYAVPEAREFTLRINKAKFNNTLVWKTGEDKDYDFVYDGNGKSIGYGDGYDFGLEGTTSGLNGEFPDGAKIKFRLGTDKTSYDSLRITDAGKYLVTATFTMPDGSERNYEPLADITYTYIVKQAEYYGGFTFGGEKEYINGSVVYDGAEHTFALTFDDKDKGEKFLSDVTVTYIVNGVKNFSSASVKDAGDYTVEYKLSFRSPKDGDKDDETYISKLKRNYVLPSDGGFSCKILRKDFDVSEVKLVAGEYVYDGTERFVTASGLYDNLAVRLDKNGFINAGSYLVTAYFDVSDDFADNYRFLRNGEEVTSLSVTLVIDKARIVESEVEIPSITGGEYDPEKTLADYPLPLLYRWNNPSATPTCDVTLYRALYNKDEQNYYDTAIYVPLTITKKEISLSDITVESRFLPYTGKAVYPTVTGSDVLTVTADCVTDATAIGKHTFTDVTVVLTDDKNYILTGEKIFADVDIYVYDGNLYLYDGMRLMQYKGMESEVAVPDGTLYVYDGAFAGKEKITSLTLPSSVENFSAGALRGMNGLNKLTLPYLGQTPASNGKLTDVFGSALPESLRYVTVTDMTTVPDGAFRDCVNLRKIEFTQNVDEIGSEAFYNCRSLTEADYKYAATVGKYAFYGCKSLTKLSLPIISGESDGKVTYLFGTDSGDNSYKTYSLSEFDLTSGSFDKVESYAFAGLTTLTEIRLPDTVTEFGYGAFSDIQAKIYYEAKLSVITAGMYAGYNGVSVNLPDSVTGIDREAFKDASYLTEIVLPERVTDIEEYAFRNVKARITFAGENVTVFKNRVFFGYAGETVNIPSSVTTVESYAFKDAKIKKITVPNTIENFGNNVFDGCENLTEVNYNLSVLPSATFNNCVSLRTATVPNVTEIGNNAFYGCVSMTDISLPKSLTAISDGAFYACDSLRTVVFGCENIPTFGKNIFGSNVKISAYIKKELVVDLTNILTVAYPNVTVYAVAE